MSPAVLEEARRDAGRGPGQSPLFDDLRRALPGSPPGRPHPDPEPGSPGPVTARGERDPRSGGGSVSLEAHLERVWEDLLAAGAAECPVCSARMVPEAEHAACGGCGSTLA